MLEELRRIISIEGTTSENGLQARRLALENWIQRHVSEVNIENSILKKHLTASDQEFIKFYLASQLAEKILEDHASVINENNKIKVKVLVLNKEFPKNKDN